MTSNVDNNIKIMVGTQGEDQIAGSNSSEIISGRGGNDVLNGNSGSDAVYGGRGDDQIQGGSGNDTLYGGGGPSIVDMANIVIQEDYEGTVTFLDEGAGYRNSLGMYKVDENGEIYDVEILFPNSSKNGSGGDLVPGESQVSVSLNAGDRIGFFIVSNGAGQSKENYNLLSDETASFTLRDLDGNPGNIDEDDEVHLWHIDDETGEESIIYSRYGNDLFHSAADRDNDYSPNPDNYPHTVGKLLADEGAVILGFEDLKYGGDKDYDDVSFRFDIGESNARVLDPNIRYDDDGNEVVRDATYDGEGNMIDEEGNILFFENDLIYGGSGSDTIYGMTGHDRLYGDNGHDFIYGNPGQDQLYGGSGNDYLHGGPHDDLLDGGTGNDELYGGSGDDRLVLDSGNDLYSGGPGTDTLDCSAVNGRLSIDLHLNSVIGKGDNTVIGCENVIGTGFNDTIRGDLRDNNLNGGSGDDIIRGMIGNDELTGGGGEDRFVWFSWDIVDNRTDTNYVDRVKDFGSDDVLDFRSIVSTGDENDDDFDADEWFLLTESNGNTTVGIDLEGKGENFTDVCVLEGVTGLDADTMCGDGSIAI